MSLKVRTAVILAGGLGTRLRDTVPDVPKPMAPVKDRPFLELLMDFWITQGVEHFVLSVGYRHEIISKHFGGRYRDATITYVVEETPLGTGGGLLLAAQTLHENAPFLVLNGDTYFAVSLTSLSHFFHSHDADWAFSLFRSTDTKRYMAMDIGKNGRIMALTSPAENQYPLANGGVYLVHPRALKSFLAEAGKACSLEAEIFARGLSEGQRLFGLEFTGTFIDIGVPADYFRAGELIS